MQKIPKGKIKFQIIGIIFLLCFLLFTVNVTFNIGNIAFANLNSIEIQEDSFSVSNTIITVSIFMLEEVPRIGQTWNVTLQLDDDSTTGVEWEAKTGSNYENMWEGPAQFTQTEGEIVTHQYISHVCGDNMGHTGLFFGLTLIDSTGSISGSYSAELLFGGYANPPECGTGQLIVPDISEWLASQSSQENPNLAPIIIFGCLVIIILVTNARKRNP